MRWPCAMLLGAGAEWADWQLMPGAQVGRSRSGEAGELGPVQTTSWQQTRNRAGALDLLPGLLVVPWAMLQVHSFL